MKKIAFIHLIILLVFRTSAQDCDLSKLEQPAKDRELYEAFWNSEVIIVIGNQAPGQEYYEYVINRGRKEANGFLVKKKNELTKNDFE